MSQQATLSLFTFLESCLIDYGLSPQYAGFHYLAHAIHWTILDKQATKHLSTDLYPRVAKSFNVSVSAVEHGIRNLLNSALTQHRSVALTTLVSSMPGSFTNARCIALLSRVIKTQYFLAKQQTGSQIQPPTVS